jgi:hypothetical protein
MMPAIKTVALSMAAAFYAVATTATSSRPQREFALDIVDRPRPVSEAVLPSLQSINPGLSFQLLCMPDYPCALNIHPIALAKGCSIP